MEKKMVSVFITEIMRKVVWKGPAQMCTAAEEGGRRMVENGEKESKQEVL